jgi:AAA family ATP:ADP antiporter
MATTPLLYRVLRAEPHEAPAVAWAFAYFFLLLCSYYILRPVRDALAVELGEDALKRLFTATFVAMLALVPLFGWLCVRLPRAKLLPVVYAFFVLNLLGFAIFLPSQVFFVWLSVFNLFAVSVRCQCSGATWRTSSPPRRRRGFTARSPPAAAAGRSQDRF